MTTKTKKTATKSTVKSTAAKNTVRHAAKVEKAHAERAAAEAQAPAPPPPAPAKAAPEPAAKREVIPDDAKLTVLFKEVPGRPGTLAHRTRALYLKAKTVGEWREAVKAADADAGYLHPDVKRGLIRIG